MNKPLRIAALFGAAAAMYVAIPNNADAHCVPGWIHMNGIRHNYYDWYSWTYEDWGCNAIGTVDERCECVSWANYSCVEEYCYYNCDGC
jgi:hypothetical protein